jgi:hypothetical protein
VTDCALVNDLNSASAPNLIWLTPNIVFDEGNGYCPLDGSSEDCVYAVWAGPLAKTSYATSNLYNHYSWTRTIEANWNLASLTSNDANAKLMTEFFKTRSPPVLLTTSFT